MDEETKQLLRDLNSVLQTLAALLACYLTYRAGKKTEKPEEAEREEAPDEETL